MKSKTFSGLKFILTQSSMSLSKSPTQQRLLSFVHCRTGCLLNDLRCRHNHTVFRQLLCGKREWFRIWFWILRALDRLWEALMKFEFLSKCSVYLIGLMVHQFPGNLCVSQHLAPTLGHQNSSFYRDILIINF